MLHQEVAILWCLSFSQSPNIIKLLGYCDVPKAIVMPLYRGGDLASYIFDLSNPLSSDLLFNLAMGIVSGLSTLHLNGISHRDIKSQNILLDEKANSKYLTPVICDFGLARVSSQRVVIKPFTTFCGLSPM
eukprot:Lithocolla_globosa_v1_NODE_8601_length_802_cov_8.783133.p1 type:complete len:131 gc:universal NODE_8601_length_802_cov_8.783133:219-611(+)